MRIGLTGGAASLDRIVDQAQQAEAEGFSSLWYASVVAGDPLVAMAIAGRATKSIELGTAVLQTYPCHPLLQANRVAAAANAMARPGFVLGLGPSHAPIVEGVLGLSYDHPGRNTEEYLRIVVALLRDGAADFNGIEWSVHTADRVISLDYQVPVLLAALSPRMLRIAGQIGDGVVLWMASAAAIEAAIMPRLRAAVAATGRPQLRVVAGLPVAVHSDLTEARDAVSATATGYAGMANYRRIIDAGNGTCPADVALLGDESAVAQQLDDLIAVGVTDIWAQPVAVGDNRAQRRDSLQRTRALLGELARS